MRLRYSADFGLDSHSTGFANGLATAVRGDGILVAMGVV